MTLHADLPRRVRAIDLGNLRIRLSCPDPGSLAALSRDNPAMEAPYWGRVWPASIALARHLATEVETMTGLRVLELGTGLGLPALTGAARGAQVLATDLYPEPLAWVRDSASMNRLQVATRQFDWSGDLTLLSERWDLILLSDVNYDPSGFDALHRLLLAATRQGIGVWLSTPQRLLARPFVNLVAPLIRERLEREVEEDGRFSVISIFRC
jgi:predicted nicotinamide N-methyase